MADTTITALPTASGIDGSVDWLAIDRTSLGVTQKINRNTLLGVSGQPMDISSSQNVTNKTLDNTNTITVKDTLFTLQDDGDTTKQAKFQLSGITTATTRTYTLPNASSTLADIATAQTFTNKTLTSPVITGGSIDNSTITVDAITGHTASTTGSIYGLSIASGKVGTNGVVTASVTASAITPPKINDFDWTKYIIGISYSSVVAGTWTKFGTTGTGTIASVTYVQSAGAQNEEIQYKLVVGAGTYSMFLYADRDVNRGIYTVSIDGVSVGTVDGYAATRVAGVVATVSTAITVATNKLITVNVKMATKNAGSAGYYANLYDMTLVRTA